VDIVALGLHGAMLAHGCDDCEADVLERVRGIVGPGVPVGALLDPHCHLTAAKLAAADVLVCFKEYPHTDYVERAHELLDLLAGARESRFQPRMAMFDCRMLAAFPTREEPMRSFVARMKAAEDGARILSVSLAHGFPAADVPDVGARMLVVANGDVAAAAALAEELGRDLYAQRERLRVKRPSLDEAIDQALSIAGSPVVIAETSDNPGSGDAGDGTLLLRRLLERGLRNVCLGPLWDPIAVGFCLEAGDGAELDLRIGGKASRESGEPIDARVRVLRAVEEAWQTAGEGARVSLGAAAAVVFDGVTVVLTTLRHQAIGPDLFTDLGVDLSQQRLVVVKSVQQFRIGFERLAAGIVYARATGGRSREYLHARRPMWPMDADPLADASARGAD
jgi:microcystin degradation protein MlrC